jgi:hypothetical protein
MAEKPQRITLSRAKGWRMPPNTVSVARPGRWGNPYWDIRRYGRDFCVALFRETAQGFWSPKLLDHLPDHFVDSLYKAHCAWIKRIGGHPLEMARSELRGKNLACWCKPGEPCHADVLLELANSEPE